MGWSVTPGLAMGKIGGGGSWYKEVVSTHPIWIYSFLRKEPIFFAEVHLARNDVCKTRKSPLNCWHQYSERVIPGSPYPNRISSW